MQQLKNVKPKQSKTIRLCVCVVREWLKHGTDRSHTCDIVVTWHVHMHVHTYTRREAYSIIKALAVN